VNKNNKSRAVTGPVMALVVVFVLMMATMVIVSADNPHTFTNAGGSMGFADGAVTVMVPQGSTSSDVAVTYTALTGDAIPGSAPSGTAFGAQVFSLTVDPATTFSRNVNVTVAYNAADISAVGGNTNNVKLYIYDAGFQEWNENASAIRDSANNTLTTQQTTLGSYAIVNVGATPPPVPTATPEAMPPESVGDWAPGTGLLLGLLLAGAGLALGGGYLFFRRPRNAGV
jgi:hypothetical protein